MLWKVFTQKKNNGIEIIEYKSPSFIKSVNYKQIVDSLFKLYFVSDNQEIENTVKKLVANVNYGLLEKSNNTKTTKLYL